MSWGFINKKGEIVIEPRFAFVNDFKEGLAGVAVHTVYPQKYKEIRGFINLKGEFVIYPQYDWVKDFCGGLAAVTIGDISQRKSGVIDKEGNYVFQLNYKDTSVGSSMYEGLTKVRLDNKTIYVDSNGNIVLDPPDTLIKKEYRTDKPLMPIAKGNKYGYELNGQIVIDPIFDKAEYFLGFNYDYARVKINNKYGYIDKTGSFIVKPEFDELDYYEEELAAAKIGNKWGFINKVGNIVIKPEFDSVRSFSEGLAVVIVGGKYGAINKVGEYAIAPRYDKLYSFSEGLAGVEFSKIMYDDNHKEWFCRDKVEIHDKDFRYVLQASEGYLTGNRSTGNTNAGQTQRTTRGSTNSNPTNNTVRSSTVKPVSSSPRSDSNSSSKGGCYVATAVYGSYNCPQVWTLRRFRDNTLDRTWYGRAFIKTYYAISPTLVRWFGETSWFKEFWRKPLDKLVASLRNKGVEDTPYIDKY